jgi:hypothetical protein
MTPENMLTIAAVAFVLICWAVERPAWFKWVGLILCVMVVGASLAHAQGQHARRYHGRQYRQRYPHRQRIR